jgi:hypothetical protein
MIDFNMLTSGLVGAEPLRVAICILLEALAILDFAAVFPLHDQANS